MLLLSYFDHNEHFVIHRLMISFPQLSVFLKNGNF